MNATATKVKGKLKKVEGSVTNDKVRQAQGAVEETVGSVAAKIKRGVRKAKTTIAKKVATTKVGRKMAAAKVMP